MKRSLLLTFCLLVVVAVVVAVAAVKENTGGKIGRRVVVNALFFS